MRRSPLPHADLSIARPVERFILAAWNTVRASHARIGRVHHVSRRPRGVADSISRRPRDPRDLLDEGVDLLLTRDPAALDYAATLPQFQSVPLAWQRTHVLLTPGRARSSPSLSDEARQTLAERRGSRRSARCDGSVLVADGLSDCEDPASSSPGTRVASLGPGRLRRERRCGSRSGRASSGWSRDQAQLTSAPSRPHSRAGALLWRGGGEATPAYVLSLDSRPLDPCRELQALMEGAPWLDPGDHRPAGRHPAARDRAAWTIRASSANGTEDC